MRWRRSPGSARRSASASACAPTSPNSCRPAAPRPAPSWCGSCRAAPPPPCCWRASRAPPPGRAGAALARDGGRAARLRPLRLRRRRHAVPVGGRAGLPVPLPLPALARDAAGGLHRRDAADRLQALLDGLRSAASPLLARFGFADPTGAFLGLARDWLARRGWRRRDGAWFAAQGGKDGEAPPAPCSGPHPRQPAGWTRPGQQAAIGAFRAAFEPLVRLRTAAAERPRRLRRRGGGAIRGDVRADQPGLGGCSAGSSVALPLAAAARAGRRAARRRHAAGFAATALVAGGAVHGIALGFGMTMLGVAVDYPILLVGLRQRRREPRPRPPRGSGRRLRLAAAAAATGLAAMLGSGFPGLVQLGVFAGGGLLVAAAADPLGAAAGWSRRQVPIAPRPLPGPWLRRAAGAARPAPAGARPAGGRGAGLAAAGGPRWQRDLAALSPVPAAAQALDAELRRQLGAPDVRLIIALGPATEAAVLAASERLGATVWPAARPAGASGGARPAQPLAAEPGDPGGPPRRPAGAGGGAGGAARGDAGAALPARRLRRLSSPRSRRAATCRRSPRPAGRARRRSRRGSRPCVTRRDGPVAAWRPGPGGARPGGAGRGGGGARRPAHPSVDVKAETEGLLRTTARATLALGAGRRRLALGLLALGAAAGWAPGAARGGADRRRAAGHPGRPDRAPGRR